jgi:hypothetical protein
MKESSAMNFVHSTIGFEYVRFHRREIEREVAAQQLVDEARRTRPASAGLRRRIGAALLRAGEYLQRARDRRVAVDLHYAADALRLAR